MATFLMKLLVLLSITMATLDTVYGQIGTAQIISLLTDVNGTSANMSATLPQLATLLKNQVDMQIISNLSLENSTAATDEMTSILPQIRSFLQEQLQRQDQMIETQRDHNAASLSLLQSHQNSLDQIASTLTNTTTFQAQIALTQIQLANTFTQMVSLLQMQGQQLQNMTTTMNSVVTRVFFTRKSARFYAFRYKSTPSTALPSMLARMKICKRTRSDYRLFPLSFTVPLVYQLKL